MSDTGFVSEDLVQAKEGTARAAHSPAFALAATPVPVAPAREKFIGFVRDEASATILHGALAPSLPGGAAFHIVDFRTALSLLHRMTTPEVVLVDLSGEDQPINAMMDLAEAVEPGTVVLAIGETHNVNFYRTVTKGMGVREYLAKPLTPESVRRHFLDLARVDAPVPRGSRGGRMISVCGTRGGIGCSTVATNLAWMIGADMHRHTVLLDSDLHTGTAALSLDVKPLQGLSEALESPQRVDQLLLERSTQQASERLHVMAAMEPITRDVGYQQQGAATLSQVLRSRYNFVIADAGARLSPFSRDLMYLSHQRVIVLDPSVIAIRNFERLLAMPGGPLQSPRVLVVLNHAGCPGGLSMTYMEEALGLRFDCIIPELPRIVPKATQFGKAAAETRGPFRNAMRTLANALGARTVDEPPKVAA
jgi:pilus assembly protein CpaE